MKHHLRWRREDQDENLTKSGTQKGQDGHSLDLGVWVPGSWRLNAQDKSSKQNESREERLGADWSVHLVPSVPVKCIKFQRQLQVDWLEETPQHFFN